MQTEYSRRSPAVKRLMKEAQELKEPTEQYFAQPLDDNLFEWHFTVRGPPDSNFANGVYHGRITLPPEYPMKPPSIMLLTPTGRFEVNTKICLSISGHHPETWQPSWSIRTVLLAIIGFMPTKGEGAIGSLDYTPEERKVLARRSQDWKCETCGTPNRSILPPVTSKSASIQKEAAEVAAQIQFKKEEKKSTQSLPTENTSPPPAAQPNQVPAPIPPNPFNMWNPQGGMMPFQAPFMAIPPNFVMPGQAPAPVGQGNVNPQTPVNQASPTSQASSENAPMVSGGSTAPTVDGSSPTSNPSDAPNPGDAPSSGSSGTSLRQRGSAAGRTAESTSQEHLTSQRTASSTHTNQPVAREVQNILCPLVTMTIFSLVIIVLLFRRIYITYAYKFI